MQQTRIIAALFVMLAIPFTPLSALAESANTRQVVELPLVSGWYEGREVLYVTTDVSDAGAAKEMGANYVPRLANALTPAERAPGQTGAVERIYRVVNFKQGSILPSIPEPVGAANRNRNYSPIWQVYQVTWAASSKPYLLRSEEDLLAAEEKGLLSIGKSNIVVNCPVVFFAGAGLLPHAVIKTVPASLQ